jgi:hypothetical protein
LSADIKRERIIMKKKFLRLGMAESYVFKKSACVCILMIGCASLSFGAGLMDGTAKGTRATSTLGPTTSAAKATRETKAANAAEAAEVAEVKESNFVPSRNPAAGRATSTVYATPAEALKPEVERLHPPVYAISGVRNQEVREDSLWEVVDIVVELPARETFSRGLLEGEDVSDWILNLPAGLEGRAHNVKKGATSIRIYVAGTPTATARKEIKVKIPGSYLAGRADIQFVSPTETESIRVWEASQTAYQ